MEKIIKYICMLIPFSKLRRQARNDLAYWLWKNKILSLCESMNPSCIQIINHHLGEVTMFCLTHKYWYKGGILILTKNYHKYLVDMFMPQIPYIVCERSGLCKFEKKAFNYEGIIFEELLTTDELRCMNSNNKTFINNWMEYLNLSLEEVEFSLPKISEKTRMAAERKMKSCGISLDRLIFIADEAQSVVSLSSGFWEKIITVASKMGFHVFLNKSKGNSDEVLTIDEAFYVAEKSELIIGLRSGLIDLLCMIRTNINVIYTNNSCLGDIQPTYTLSQYPYCSNGLKEYNVNQMTEEEILSSIIKNIEELR